MLDVVYKISNSSIGTDIAAGVSVENSWEEKYQTSVLEMLYQFYVYSEKV